jgi:uncharacterized protein YbaR (Trm112 family)
VFIELIDSLRCPNDHEESWLVASIAERSDRDIVRGLLGCPVCRAEYPIHGSVVIFGVGNTPPAPARDSYVESDHDAAVRCAALLDIHDSGGLVVLVGEWLRVARALVELSQVAILVVDPPPSFPLDSRVSGIRIGDRFPLAPGVARGIAIGVDVPDRRLVDSAARALRARGRLLAPADTAVPPGVSERARDDRYWLGEAEALAVPVPLAVRRER